MGCGNPPGLTDPLKGHYKFGLTDETMEACDGVGAAGDDNNSFEAGLMSSSFTSPINTVFPSFDIDMHGTFQYLEKDLESTISRLSDLINHNSLADSQTDANLVNPNRLADSQSNANQININSSADSQTNANRINLNSLADSQTNANRINLNSLADFQTGENLMDPEFSLRESYINTVPSDNFLESGFDMNVRPAEGESAIGFAIKEYGAEAKTGSSGISQRCRDFSSPGGSTSALPHARNIGIAGLKVDMNIVPVQLGPLGKDDGNFLTLGTRPNSNFSTQEVACKLDEAVSSRPRSSLPAQNSSTWNNTQMASSASRIRLDAHESSNSAYNLCSRMPDSSLNPMQVSSLQNRQANESTHLPASSDTIRDNPVPVSLPSRRISNPRIGLSNSFSSEPTTSTTHFTTHPAQDSYRQRFVDLSSKSPVNLPSDTHRRREMSSRHAQLGSVGNNVQSADGGQFPKRLGYQPNDFATARSAEGNSLRDMNSRLVDFFQMPNAPPHAAGIPSSHLSSQIGQFRPSVCAAGQTHNHQGAPAQFLLDVPRMHYSTGQSLKRPAGEDLPTTSLVGQRRRVNPSQPHYQGPIIPPPIPPPPHIPASYQRQIIQSSIPAHNPYQRPPNAIQPSIPAHHNPALYRSQSIQPPHQNRIIPPGYQSQVIRASNPPAAHIPSNYQNQTTQGHSRAPNLGPPHVPHPFQTHTIRAPSRALNPAAAAAHIPASHQTHTTRCPSGVRNPAAVRIPPAAHYIKWQGGIEVTPKSIGQKCHLCKRDLSFTAGPVFQPTNPPPVAVLPCGHTFHDHCLQIIVPTDQTKNPPCIPCAIGET